MLYAVELMKYIAACWNHSILLMCSEDCVSQLSGSHQRFIWAQNQWKPNCLRQLFHGSADHQWDEPWSEIRAQAFNMLSQCRNHFLTRSMISLIVLKCIMLYTFGHIGVIKTWKCLTMWSLHHIARRWMSNWQIRDPCSLCPLLVVRVNYEKHWLVRSHCCIIQRARWCWRISSSELSLRCCWITNHIRSDDHLNWISQKSSKRWVTSIKTLSKYNCISASSIIESFQPEIKEPSD